MSNVDILGVLGFSLALVALTWQMITYAVERRTFLLWDVGTGSSVQNEHEVRVTLYNRGSRPVLIDQIVVTHGPPRDYVRPDDALPLVDVEALPRRDRKVIREFSETSKRQQASEAVIVVSPGDSVCHAIGFPWHEFEASEWGVTVVLRDGRFHEIGGATIRRQRKLKPIRRWR
jgi:hypothetical protein